ncbi:hypothetical protein [Chryseobacterium scophthalmum]|uniref:hypothetical protein n=1 Tax=Chryseobacterium scophthalmum TaxID=59733 RepID=UPI001FD9AF08|nr:hypothetical protein [Chryseobacterium scophthalmum]
MKNFHPSSITGIYFGIKTPNIIKESFYGLFKNMDVKFYEVFPLDFKLINETKRELIYDLEKFEFEILQHRINVYHESYYIFYKGTESENVLKEFILSFKEKFCIKEDYTLIYTIIEKLKTF